MAARAEGLNSIYLLRMLPALEREGGRWASGIISHLKGLGF